MATQSLTGLPTPFFPRTIAHFVSLCHSLVILVIVHVFFNILIFAKVTCDQLPSTVLLQKDSDSLKAQLMVSIF